MPNSLTGTFSGFDMDVRQRTDFCLDMAKESLHTLLTEAIVLPPCTTINRLQIKLNRAQSLQTLGQVIHETYLFLDSLRKALDIGKFDEIISRENMRKLQELDHYRFRNSLEQVSWHNVYRFR